MFNFHFLSLCDKSLKSCVKFSTNHMQDQAHSYLHLEFSMAFCTIPFVMTLLAVVTTLILVLQHLITKCTYLVLTDSIRIKGVSF